MKKYVILAVTLSLIMSAFASCSSKKNDSEPTSGDISSVLENESVSGDYSNVSIDSRVPMKAGECEIYLDADHNSEKKDGDSVLYYSDSDLVMKKTYSAGKLVSKSIYGNYEIKLTYTYDSNNALTEVSASGEAGDGSFTKASINYRSDSSISSYAYLSYDKQTDKHELYSYDFDSSGNLIKGFDNFESYSEALNSALLGSFGMG
ncbi:MAG: hypothetical protein PUG93_00570 [Oscillospiraceae bacterium]|nr:hypothetical protein [Oscillospiraceae bacterium]MDY3936839.1 hypothetical protein [Oscillospiraceae bacterium]